MRRKFLLKRFRHYVVLLMLPVLLCLLVMAGSSALRLNRNLSSQGRQMLENVNKNLEISLLNLSTQNRQFTVNPYMILSLKRILTRNHSFSYADAINMRSLNAILRSFTETYPYVDSVSLYLSGYQRYYASDVRIQQITEEDAPFLAALKSMEPGLSTRAFLFPDDPEHLVIIQRMVLHDGAVIMKVDIEAFKAQLGYFVVGEENLLAFLDREGHTLFTLNAEEKELTDLESLSLPGNGEKGRWLSIGGSRYLIQCADNETYQLRIVSMIPSAVFFRRLLEELRSWLLIIVSAILAILAISYVTTKRNFDYFDRIIQIFSRAEQGEYPAGPKENRQIRDEYDLIFDNVISLFLGTVRLQSELKEKQYEVEAVQLCALQTQINPHFLFNTLQTIQLEQRGMGEKTSKLTGDLADILKYALTDPYRRPTLEEELLYLKKYVSIQKARFGESFLIYYEVEPEALSVRVFPMLLQPLVENSILHGVRGLDRRGYIKLRVFLQDGYACFHVVDNGQGMSPEKCREIRESLREFQVHSIGLANVNNRLRLYYGEASSIKLLSSEGRGTALSFKIPIQEDLKPIG